MKEDRSETVKMYCDSCKRRSSFFELFAPEGEVVLLKCLNCGAIVEGVKPKPASKLVTRGRVEVIGLAVILALLFLASRRRFGTTEANSEGS